MVVASPQTHSPGSTSRVPSGTQDVVFTFAWVNWEAAQRRGMNFSEDRLLLRLFADARVRRLIVADTARSAPIKLARDLLERPRGDDGFPTTDARRRVQPLRWRRDDPAGPRAARRWVASYERTLRHAAGRMGMERPTIVTFHPLIAAFGDFAWAGPVTYYAMDDWASHPAKRRWRPLLTAAHAEIGARRRRVVAVSSAILELIRPTGPAIVVPNGIEPTEWTAVNEPPAWMADAPRPRLIYTGSLDGRLDRAWLTTLASALPEASIHLVGRVLDAEHLAALGTLPNVTIHPNVDRAAIAATVAGADLGLLPHVDTPLTRAMSPLKVYEYLAAGLPVAATDLEPVRTLGPRVALAPSGGDFTTAVRTALALGRASEDERQGFIAANSWERRHAQILDFALAPS
jgi:teichuronic acid biosynthesis glycosyltransferase TuaH